MNTFFSNANNFGKLAVMIASYATVATVVITISNKVVTAILDN